MECAEVSLNRMLHIVLMAKMKLMDNNPDKMEIYNLLDSLEFDIKLLNNKGNVIERDLK